MSDEKVVPLRLAATAPEIGRTTKVSEQAIASMLDKVDTLRGRVATGEIESIAVCFVTTDAGIGSSWDCTGGSWALISSLRRLQRRLEDWAFD